MNKHTEVIFVRHAKVNYTPEDKERALSKEGMKQREEVLNILKDKEIDIIYSSPFKRAIDTIKPYSLYKNMTINILDDLRERKVSDVFIDDFKTFSTKQWNDFNYKLNKGESLREVQDRGIKVVENIVRKNKGKNIVIGTHGTFLGILLNFYEKRCDYEFWKNLKMPAIISITYDSQNEVKNILETKLNGDTVIIK